MMSSVIRIVAPLTFLIFFLEISHAHVPSFVLPDRSGTRCRWPTRPRPSWPSSRGSKRRRTSSIGSFDTPTSRPSGGEDDVHDHRFGGLGGGGERGEGDDEWISLVDHRGDRDGKDDDNDDDASHSPVRKLVLVRGVGDDIPRDGMDIELRYNGTLFGTPPDTWSVNDVVDCWLPNIQGMGHLSPIFEKLNIDGRTLANLTEEYCLDAMGMDVTRMQAKKLVMASRRLVRQRYDHPSGTVFDSSDARGRNYEFVLVPDGGGVIRAMDIAVRTMRVGERSLVICRSDYGYGSEGLRTNGGVVIVPPFATLCFDLTLVGAE
ncbi:hypothetical protein ACHAXA_001230 [Cyclostephanos tholiformis]|uniref:peptidylprolyl isomerase n=1 Tax=Cyclostephanos tholiformis TaxID=382380 RepID=A0ABD3R799_9STRA